MSRQPPPPGLPPRPSGNSYRHNNDSYRPSNDNYSRHENNPPPAPRDMYQFGGGNDRTYRPSYDQRGPPRHDSYSTGHYAPGTEPHRNSDSYRPSSPRDRSFDFRHAPPPNIDFSQGRSHRQRSRSRSLPRQPYSNRESNGYSNQRDRDNRGPSMRSYNSQRGGARGGFRGRGAPRLASDRAFLKTNRAPTPELMPGMDEDTGNVRYKDVNEMSDSDEAEMDMSDDDNANEAEQPRKKQARTDNKAADGDSVPRWSNPDPYTALPPPDESQRKKKDVVKLIRKSRVTNSSDSTSKPATTDDFISFDFGDDEEPKAEDGPTNESGNGILGAPTGPRTQLPPSRVTQHHESGYTRNKIDPPSGSKFNPINPRQEPSRLQINLPDRPTAQVPKKPAAFADLISDPALGNRKRNARDEIKGPPLITSTFNRGPSKGEVLNSWKPKPNSPATPWIDMDHSKTANMGFWLHKEIMDFYYYVKPRDFEQRVRANLVHELGVSVKKFWRNSQILSFGSFPAGLYLPTSDMDIVCVSNEFLSGGRKVFCQAKREMFKFSGFLQTEHISIPGSMEVITKAKVPIIKYVDRLTGLKVDISFENDTGLVANKTFQDWKTEFPAMPILVTMIKHLLAMRGLNEPVNGGIGGFSTICLVVSLLQHMPQVQSRNMLPEEHLGEVLMEFLDLYGNQFNNATTAISMKPPGYVPKSQLKQFTYKANIPKLSIIDPNTPTNDISGGSSNTPRILECFSNAYRDLQKRMGTLQTSSNRVKESILSCVLAGNYSSFELQRDHLAHVHEKLFGPIEESV